MMRLEPIFEVYPEPCSEREYLKQVVDRVRAIVGDELDYIETIALIYVIGTDTFVFADGFVINDDVGSAQTLGWLGASAVAACFCETPRQDVESWIHSRLNEANNPAVHAATNQIFLKFDQQCTR